jgi:hypothetical protein
MFVVEQPAVVKKVEPSSNISSLHFKKKQFSMPKLQTLKLKLSCTVLAKQRAVARAY